MSPIPADRMAASTSRSGAEVKMDHPPHLLRGNYWRYFFPASSKAS